MTPKTIRHPGAFLKSPPAGFDGVFDWSWTQGCFKDTRITPMDVDAIVERNGHFLVFETKADGVPIPVGQLLTLKALHKLGRFTIFLLWGKPLPAKAEIWKAASKEIYHVEGIDNLRDCVSKWFMWADGWMP